MTYRNSSVKMGDSEFKEDVVHPYDYGWSVTTSPLVTSKDINPHQTFVI